MRPFFFFFCFSRKLDSQWGETRAIRLHHKTIMVDVLPHKWLSLPKLAISIKGEGVGGDGGELYCESDSASGPM